MFSARNVSRELRLKIKRESPTNSSPQTRESEILRVRIVVQLLWKVSFSSTRTDHKIAESGGEETASQRSISRRFEAAAHS
ncbi:hypothetical protein P8C59_003641 [Phyllachora maydis]|uniref:Uncharacterized protein n=1 Tax=Phyllachora maydis TaxID=1825666 RepID=A0AAD9MCM2_9PEZI|nr:hypothetical protein P8C59_003641 [Phyllachora maydis]